MKSSGNGRRRRRAGVGVRASSTRHGTAAATAVPSASTETAPQPSVADRPRRPTSSCDLQRRQHGLQRRVVRVGELDLDVHRHRLVRRAQRQQHVARDRVAALRPRLHQPGERPVAERLHSRIGAQLGETEVAQQRRRVVGERVGDDLDAGRLPLLVELLEDGCRGDAWSVAGVVVHLRADVGVGPSARYRDRQSTLVRRRRSSGGSPGR